MAKAAAAGHRVVLVAATRGELGEPVPGVLDEGEELWQRRVIETHRSAEVLGADRVEFLGYEDSGMMGEPTNDNEACFWRADIDEAAERLAAILRDVDADVLTIYDDHGNYGHPDHIQVHRVGKRAAELAGVTGIFEATMNRDAIKRMMEQAQQEGTAEDTFGEDADEIRQDMEGELGEPEENLTHAIDVTEFVGQKRQSMVAHASQISDDSFFMKMPEEVFAAAFGTEWYIEHGHKRLPGAPFGDDLFAGRD